MVRYEENTDEYEWSRDDQNNRQACTKGVVHAVIMREYPRGEENADQCEKDPSGEWPFPGNNKEHS
jgi:hypothetical protein